MTRPTATSTSIRACDRSMHVRATGGDWQPALWTHVSGKGRVVVDTLGHDAGAFAHPVHRRIVARAALWASGADDATVAVS